MKKSAWLFALAGLLLAGALAWFVAPHASENPDGLEKVAEDKGFLGKAEADPTWKKAPAPDYKFPNVKDERRSTALAGVVGTVIVFVLGVGAAWFLRLRKRKAAKA